LKLGGEPEILEKLEDLIADRLQLCEIQDSLGNDSGLDNRVDAVFWLNQN